MWWPCATEKSLTFAVKVWWTTMYLGARESTVGFRLGLRAPHCPTVWIFGAAPRGLGASAREPVSSGAGSSDDVAAAGRTFRSGEGRNALVTPTTPPAARTQPPSRTERRARL
ncbi:hypothetical protein GCM10023085_61960 [Actinomadura viridis]